MILNNTIQLVASKLWNNISLNIQLIKINNLIKKGLFARIHVCVCV